MSSPISAAIVPPINAAILLQPGVADLAYSRDQT